MVFYLETVGVRPGYFMIGGPQLRHECQILVEMTSIVSTDPSLAPGLDLPQWGPEDIGTAADACVRRAGAFVIRRCFWILSAALPFFTRSLLVHLCFGSPYCVFIAFAPLLFTVTRSFAVATLCFGSRALAVLSTRNIRARGS
jgi:hypothetical protein